MPAAYIPKPASVKAKYVPRLDEPGGVRKLLAAIIAEARRGDLDTRDGYRLCLMCGVLLKAMETSDLADRLEALEAAVPPHSLRRIA